MQNHIIDARIKGSVPPGTLYDLNKNQKIPGAYWANLKTGEFEAQQCDSRGQPILIEVGGRQSTVCYRGKVVDENGNSRLKYVVRELDEPSGIRDLPEEIKPDAPVFKDVRHIADPLANVKCDHKNCDKLGKWKVSDEVIMKPIQVRGVYYERAKKIKTRVYCDFHYEPPAILDVKGEVIETWDEAGGVRPQ